MSTHDVPGANPRNRDVLAAGCWAEHEDGSLILVEGTEAGSVVYSIFDMAAEPPTEYRDAMPEAGFKSQFTWRPDEDDSETWTWHDKTPFPWERIIPNFPAGQRASSAEAVISAAARVAQSLNLRASAIRDRQAERPTEQKTARDIMARLQDALDAFMR